MPEYIESPLLSIGGLDFHFPCPVSWPLDGTLSCYQAFLKPLLDNADNISVSLNRGSPKLAAEHTDILDSGDGTIWSRCGDYHLVEKVVPHLSSSPIWTVVIHSEKLEAEIWFSDQYLDIQEKQGLWPVAAPSYPIDQQLAIHFLARRQGVLLHSAGIEYMGKGFMCSGVSGSGKTTIYRMFAETEGFDLLTDDRVILRTNGENGVVMHGTPWSGKGQYATSGRAPLKAVFFLKKDSEVRETRLSASEAVSRFIPVASVPWFSNELTTDTLKTIEAVAQGTPAFDLHFTKTTETIQLVTDIMNRL